MRQTATNEWKDGLNLDLHPIVTPNTVLTDNLNGTFITYNGNEFCLQNDRGNVQKASLPDGFIPIGVKEYNGVIYIVSSTRDGINQIGTYPGREDGLLKYDRYTPLSNLLDNEDNKFEWDLGYNTDTPLTIEIEPSYDGSVNLIIVADKCKPRIINSGFTVLPDGKYEDIDRNKNDENKYETFTVDRDTELIRNCYEIVNVDLVGVQSGGQLKGGNYTFYIKFGDGDFNQTDVVAESGIISIFNGNDGIPSTISGTLLDERTDKTIQLKITGVLEPSKIYSKLYIYFTREYSDTQGYRMSECGMLTDPIDLKPYESKTNIPEDYQYVWITGFEQQTPVNVEELNVDYHTIDFVRAETQHSNMLFLGNVGQTETWELYQELQQYCYDNLTVSVDTSKELKSAGYDYNINDSEYYLTTNIYKYLGYWPNEIYRFGIVFILKDGSKTPVFNINGHSFGTHIYNGNDIWNNKKGVFLMPNWKIYNDNGIISPLGLTFKWSTRFYDDRVIGWFVVRQKRIPNSICQGLLGAVDKISHTPVINNENGKWISERFLSTNENGFSDDEDPKRYVKLVYSNVTNYDTTVVRQSSSNPEYTTGNDTSSHQDTVHGGGSTTSNTSRNQVANTNYWDSERSIKWKIMEENDDLNWKSSNALFSLDPCVKSTIGSMFDGSNFCIEPFFQCKSVQDDNSKVRFKYELTNSDLSKSITTNATFVNSDTEMKMVGNVGYSTIAGSPTDTSVFKKFSTPYFAVSTNNSVNLGNLSDFFNNELVSALADDEKLIKALGINWNVNLIRGKFCPFVGLTDNSDLSLGTYTIKLKDDLTSTDRLVREQDNSEFYCVSDYFNASKTNVSVYRGDCYTNTVTMRIITNFIDQTAPGSETIVNENAWEDFVIKRDYTKTDDDERVRYDLVNLSDVNTVDLGLWITFKCLSSYNLGLRSIDTFHTDEMALMGSPRSFYPLNGSSTATGNKIPESYLLNDGLSATVGRKRYNLLPDVPYSKSEFANRIMFSNVNITDAFTNGYRTFQGLSYKDYDKQYGAITKLISLGQNIFVVMEHGLGLVPVNPKALMQTTTGEAIHIYGYGVLPDEMTIISQDYGSKYEHSVIRTPIGIYGVDTDARKIWRFSDKRGFETISDMKIESYLNDNLFTDKEQNIETCDVRTHYNALKGDLMFTFYNREVPETEERKYFKISTSGIVINVGETVEIPYETNMSDEELTLYFGENINCSLSDGKVHITGISAGKSNLRIVNKVISVTVTEEIIVEEPLKITLSKYSATMWVGDTEYIDVSFNKDGISLSDATVTSNDYIARPVAVGNTLVISALHAGTNNITITVEDLSVTCRIIVKEKRLELSYNETTLYPGDSDVVTIYNNEGDLIITADNELVTWELENDKLYLTVNSVGDTTFTISDSKSSETLLIHVDEIVPLESLVFDKEIPEQITLLVGESISFGFTYNPENYTTDKYSISFGSNNTNCVKGVLQRESTTVFDGGWKNLTPFVIWTAVGVGETTGTIEIWNKETGLMTEQYVFNFNIIDNTINGGTEGVTFEDWNDLDFEVTYE